MKKDKRKKLSNSGKYKFVSTRENYEDFSSGRVLYGAPQATNFSVRLASEIFQRCNDYLSKNGNIKEFTLYDPFCGAGYSLTVLGLLHGAHIKNIFASDSDKTILEFANKNLSLLHNEGLQKRIEELQSFIDSFGKESHKDALISANRLRNAVASLQIKTQAFEYNMLGNALLPEFIKNIDMVITDVPYGKLTSWDGLDTETNPFQKLLDTIKPRLNSVSVVAIVFNKEQQVSHEGYVRIKSFSTGHRKILLLHPSILTQPN